MELGSSRKLSVQDVVLLWHPIRYSAATTANPRRFCAQDVSFHAIPILLIVLSMSLRYVYHIAKVIDTLTYTCQCWNGSFWTRSPLSLLGLTLFPCHEGGPPCPKPGSATRNLVVLACNGVHTVSVCFCACPVSTGVDEAHQLLRTRWFPASSKIPKTVVTFECLAQFHSLSLQGKLTGYDYYQHLLHLTDNTDIDLPPVSNCLFIPQLSPHCILYRNGTASSCVLVVYGDI